MPDTYMQSVPIQHKSNIYLDDKKANRVVANSFDDKNRHGTKMF